MLTETMEKVQTVDIDEMQEFNEDSMRVLLSQMIAEDTLEEVNRKSEPVCPRRSFYTEYGKRIIDLILSGCALIVTAPINLVLAICTFFDVGRPIFFRQERPGKDGKTFSVIKFRNMTNEKDANGTLLPAKDRVTKFGEFVRKTSLDELLNFWSVFKGDMSLIGPRPLAKNYTSRFSERHKRRDAVRPGLECPFLTPADHKRTWKEQFENDIYYVEHLSFKLDVRMVFALIRTVFDRKSSSMRGSALRGSFVGYDAEGNSINSKHVPEKYVRLALQKAEEKKLVGVS